MKVLFTVSSWSTHYLSMVPIGWALQADDHDVRVLCPPGQAAAVGNAGLTPVPILDSVDMVLHNRLVFHHEAVTGRWPYPWLPLHPISGRRMTSLAEFDAAEYYRGAAHMNRPRIEQSFDRTVEFSRSWRPDLIVHDPTSLEGLLAALVTGTPAALSLWGPVGTHEPDGPALVPDDVSGSFERYGLGPFDVGLVGNVIDPCPGPVRPPTTAHRLPVRYVPYNLGGVAPDDLDRRPATGGRICVTWSTALNVMVGPDAFALPRIVAAVSGLDVETVLTATRADAAALGPVPPSVRVLEQCPLRLLLPTCDVVVHHGGAGSAMTAISEGVPQLVLSHSSEQHRVGERVAAAGLGLHLPGHLAGPEEIRAATVTLLSDPAYARRAAQVRDEGRRRPTPAELVPALDKLARS
jgi:UDP:flavonoid glycosyltransferase YjiC (YdhE family)